jgi:hypothetical protein
MKTSLFAGFLAVALAAPAAADRVEDDLQLVKKAVSPAAAKPVPRKAEPRWFHLRIVEKAGKPRVAGTGRDERATVSVNLPLGLVRSLGDDWPIGEHEGHGPGKVTLGEVLRALDSGQSLFEIEGDEATVRVWVE